jgi:phosphotransferase system enzyme I (PtsI)
MANVSSDIGCPQNATFHGIGANEYLGFGVLSFFEDCTEEVNTEYLGKEAELVRIRKAKHEAAEALRDMASRTEGSLGNDEAEIFEIYADLCLDEDLSELIEAYVSDGFGASAATAKAADELARRLEAIDDDYLKERGSDIRHAAREIRRHLSGGCKAATANTDGNERRIIVANDLSPADTVRIDKSKTAGFVLFGGSRSSHTSIISRALGIPCMIGCERIDSRFDGEFAIIDAKNGALTVNPDVELMRAFAHRASIESENSRRLESVRYTEPISSGGRRMHVFANVGSIDDIDNSYTDAVSGCGLFRSEFIFLESDRLPDEEEQISIYKKLLMRMGDRITVIRVLDIGADKIPAYLAPQKKEENPALGIRGIRFLLSNKDIFKTQLRAIIRASKFGNAAILLPMVTCESEILEVREIISEVKNELRYEEVDFAERIPLGIMIETPASAIISDRLAELCDFFSVGTNDLCQYTLAADRQNPDVDMLINNNREAVLRLIQYAADQIHKKGGWIGICGELASDTSLTERFLDMNINEISVSLPYVLKMKQAIINSK